MSETAEVFVPADLFTIAVHAAHRLVRFCAQYAGPSVIMPFESDGVDAYAGVNVEFSYGCSSGSGRHLLVLENLPRPSEMWS